MLNKNKIKSIINSTIMGISLGTMGTITISTLDYIGKNYVLIKENDSCNLLSFDNCDELNQFLNKKSVSFSDVRLAIKNNSNILETDKLRLNKVVDNIEIKMPNIDLTCLYENIKQLKIIRKENTNNNSNAVAAFDSDEHTIYIYEDQDDNFNHEVVHMTNILSLETENNLIKKSFCNNEKYTFLLEGLTEKFNHYLFDYNSVPSYKIQFYDIDIFKFILGISDEELYNIFENDNYEIIINTIRSYLDNTEMDELLRIFNKECNSLENKSNPKATIEDINKKYNILLKACINSKDKKLTSDQIYQIQQMFQTSYNAHSNVSFVDSFLVKDKIFKKLLKHLDVANNQVRILNHNDEYVRYCNIDNMVLMCNKNLTFPFSYLIGEKYIDINNNINYYIDDNILYYDDRKEYKIIPLTKLINKNCKEISLKDLIYKSKSNKNNHKSKVKTKR